MAGFAHHDRATDARRADSRGRPAVLGRAFQRSLLVLAVGVIVYGTSGPLSGWDNAWIQPPARWTWVPAIRATDADDIAANVLIYVAIGALFRFAARQRGRRWFVDFALAVAASGLVSWATEVLQQCIPGRTSSLTDVALNVGGAWIGAAAAPLVLGGLRRLHVRMYEAAQGNRSGVLAVGTFGAIVVAHTMPWIPAAPVVTWSFEGDASAGDLAQFAFFAVWGGFFAAGRFTRRTPALHELAVLAGTAILAAAALEAMQSVLAYHVASIRDFVIESLGAMSGIVAVFSRAGTAAPFARWIAATIGIVTVAIAGSMLIAVTPPIAIGKIGVNWIPFQAEFHAPFPVAATAICRTVLFLGTLGLACLEFARRPAVGAVFLALAAGAAACELVRATLYEHVATPTPILLAAVATFSAARTWSSLLPRRADVAPGASRVSTTGDRSIITSSQPI